MDRRNIDATIKKKYVLETLKWCKSYFGINTRKRTKLKVNFSDKNRKIKNSIVFGNYCFYRNTITIYLPNCKSADEIVSTTIHEYTHYLQSRIKYKDYEKYYYYSTHPCEREARRNEEKYTKVCLKEVKLLIKKP